MKDSDLLVWKGRIERAKGLQENQHIMWKDSIDLFNCNYFNKIYGSSDTERIDVHFANWYVSNLIPLVYFRDPFIFVKARHSRYDSFASTMETVLNYQWRELKLKQEFKRVIHSSFLMPPGWLKIGYTAKIGQDIAKIEVAEKKSLIKQIKDTLLGKTPKGEQQLAPEQQGVLNEYIKEESVFASWIPSWNVLIPEGYQLVSQMLYLIEIEDLPRVDFEANPMYANKKVGSTRDIGEQSNGQQLSKVPYVKSGGKGTDDETEIVRLYHVWDKRSQKRFTLSMDSDTAHFEGDWCYDMEGFPLKPLIFEESLPSLDKSNPYPVNVLTPILPQIIEQSQSRSQMVKWRKRASAIILAQKGLATEEDMAQIEETEGVQLVLVSNIQAFQMAQTPNLPQGVFDVDNLIKQDLQMATNMGQMMFAPQAGQRTATQAQIGQSGLQLKSSARVDVVEDFTVLVAESIAQTLWQFYDKEKISEIIGEPVTDNMWLPLPDDKNERRRIIRKEIQFRIDAGSTAPPKDETVDRKQLLDAISIAASIAPERLRKDETLKQLFKRFKFDKMETIVLSNDEEEIKAATEENQLLASDVPQIVSPNENHIVHMQAHEESGVMTRSMDIHKLDHGKYLGVVPGMEGDKQKSQQGSAQSGDTRAPAQSTNPEIKRQGITNEGNIMQKSQNMGVGTGL